MAKNQSSKILTKKHLARLQRERQQIKAISYIAIGVVALVVVLIGYGILSQTVLMTRQPVARVGKVNITTQSFQAHVRLTRQQMINQYTQYYQLAQMFGIDPTSNSSISSTLQQIQTQLNDSAALGQYVLNEMINSILIRQEAAKMGISVSASDVDKVIQNALGYNPEGTPTPTITPTTVVFPTLNATELAMVTITPTPSPFPTPTSAASETQSASPTVTLIPSITPTPTEYTLASFQDQFAKALDKYKALGFSEDQVRQLFEDSLIREKVYAVITKDVTHTSEEVWARHILVSDLNTAMKVRAALKNGGDWESLAKLYSIDTGSSSKGGDLGWFPKGMMIAEFENAAFSLSIGEISQPVKTKYGYHIIQVIGHEDRPLSVDDYKKKTDTFFNNWLSDVRTKTDVKIFDYYKDRVPTDPKLQ